MPQNKFNTAKLLSMSAEDFKSLPKSEQRSATRQLIDIANKRFQRGVKSWGEMGALRVYADKTSQRANKTGKTILPMRRGKQSIVGKEGTELYEEFEIAQHFLNLPTSTEQGRIETKKKFEKTIKTTLSREQYQRLFELYDKTVELNKASIISVESSYGTDNLLREMEEYLSDSGDVDTWLDESEQRLNDLYKKSIEEQNAYDEYVALKHKKGRKSNADKLRIQELEKKFGFGNKKIVR